MLRDFIIQRGVVEGREEDFTSRQSVEEKINDLFFFECIRKILVCKLGKKIYKNNNKNQSKTRGRFSASAMHNIMLMAAMSGRSVERIYYNIIYIIIIIYTLLLRVPYLPIVILYCSRNVDAI